MKTVFGLLTFMIFTATIASAQNLNTSQKTMNTKAKFGIAVNGGVPLTAGYKIAYGADLQVDIPVAQLVYITASGGYENFSYKTVDLGGGITVPEGNTNFLPVLAGVKFYFSQGFYGHAQAGYSFSTTKNGGGAFSYAPSIGYNLGSSVDVGLKYLNIGKSNASKAYGGKDIGTLELRVGYTF